MFISNLSNSEGVKKADCTIYKFFKLVSRKKKFVKKEKMKNTRAT